jgi:hypothetical protein
MTSLDPGGAPSRELFQQASERLDAGMALQLRQARRRALAGQAPPRTVRRWAPTGALAAAVLALGLAWWMPPQPAAVVPGVSAADALVLEEDTDLYAWLADAPVATSGAEGEL